VILLLTLVQLPIGLRFLAGELSEVAPAGRVLILLTVSIGGPYFAVSTTTPLLQHWFSRSEHELARDPYFFYSISNTGSLLGLLMYPFLLERTLELDAQCATWSVSYGLLVGVTVLCGILTARSLGGGSPKHPAGGSKNSGSPGQAGERSGNSGQRESHQRGELNKEERDRDTSDRDTTRLDAGTPADSVSDDLPARSLKASQNPAPLPLSRRLKWIVLALVPSAMMLAVTTRITTDVASVPLLWVLPLTAYLATYINAFARRPLIDSQKLLPLLFPAFIVIAWMTQLNPGSLLRAGGDVGLYLISAIVLHGELAADRPSTEHLTEYYFWMALGGCLGGTLVGVVAPAVFPSYLELPVVVVLAALIHDELPERGVGRWRSVFRYAWVLLVCGSAIPISLMDAWESAFAGASQIVGYGGLAVFYLMSHARGVALSLALILIPPALLPDTNTVARARTFFGVHKVIFEEGLDRTGQRFRLHRLIHGNTLHGEELIVPADAQCDPRMYYSPAGPIGQALTAAKIEGQPRRVAIVGLGAGALMAYSESGEHFDFFEIDPAVRDIASNPDYFRYLNCGEGSYEIIIGDGRIRLGEAPEAAYDVIVLDAFGSDSIPVHLLTAEALDLFLSRLKPDGVLIAHISNRHLDLEPVLGRYAQERDLHAIVRIAADRSRMEMAQGQQPTHVVVMSRQKPRITPLATLEAWREPRSNAALWTDSFSSVIDQLTLP